MQGGLVRIIYSWLAFAIAVQGGFSSPALAAKKSIQEYWSDVGLQFPMVQGMLTNENCYSSEETFNGCFDAVNAALASAGSGMRLVSSDCKSLLRPIKAGQKDPASKARAGFGPAQIVSEAPTDELGSQTRSLSQIAKTMAEARQQHQVELKSLFSKRSSRGRMDFEAVTQWVASSIIPKVKPGESYITSAALNAYLGGSKDPHTYILPQQYFEDRNNESTEVFFGIGVTLKAAGKKLYIVRPMEGSPALAAGLRAKDEIIEIAGTAVDAESYDEAMKQIKGAKGTDLTLKIRRGQETLTIRVTRGEIVQSNVSSSVLRDNGLVLGYIRLKSFIPKSCDQIKTAIRELAGNGVTGLIFDLRDNGGGMLTEANCIAGIFTGPGKTVVIEKFLDDTMPDEIHKTTEKQVTNLPMITLINAGSASASEVIAGALQDHQRSLIVGERSFGKATVQAVGAIERPKGVVMAQTIARFFQPSGRTNQVVGILPDLEVFGVPNPTEDEKIAFREEDEYSNALPKIGPAWKQPRPDYIQKLRQCLEQVGMAAKLFASRQNDAIPPDFQLLTSQDTLQCMQRN